MNFFVIFLFVSMLIITSSGIEYQKLNNTKQCNIYLIKAERGMYFYINSSTSPFSTKKNVTYDCSNQSQGTIAIDDKAHPPQIDSLFITNCEYVTVYLKACQKRVQSLHITRVKQLKINSHEMKPLEIVISDVETLTWSKTSNEYDYPEYYDMCSQTEVKTSLILKNVGLEDLLDFSIDSLFMTGVKARNFSLISYSLLHIKDSSFVNLKAELFPTHQEQVYIVNNTFERIWPGTFNLSVTESFVFSDNRVKKIFGPNHVLCPKVEIVGNTIDYANSFFLKIKLSPSYFNESIFQSLNVSSNVFQNIFAFDEDSEPDFIAIKRNYFICSCKAALNLRKLFTLKSAMINFLFDDYNNNVCVNFGNCPLRNLLGKEVRVCANTFVCPEDSSDASAITLKQLSSEFKNLTEAIHLLVEENKKFNHLRDESPENHTSVDNF